MKLLLISCLLLASALAQTECVDDPFKILQDQGIACGQLLALSSCDDLLGSLTINGLCPHSCNNCSPEYAADSGMTSVETSQSIPQASSSAMVTSSIAEPTMPIFTATTAKPCQDGFKMCTLEMQILGSNCIIGWCTPIIQPTTSNPQPPVPSSTPFQCQPGRGQYGEGKKAHGVYGQADCEAACVSDVTCVAYDFNSPRKGKMSCRIYSTNYPRIGSAGKSHWMYCSNQPTPFLLNKAHSAESSSETQKLSNIQIFYMSGIFFVANALLGFCLWLLCSPKRKDIEVDEKDVFHRIEGDDNDIKLMNL